MTQTDTKAFLQALFPELGPTALIELRGFAPGKKGEPPVLRRWCQSVQEIVTICEQKCSTLDLYFGVAARASEGATKGALAYAAALSADLDTSQSTKALERLQHRPSVVVASGSSGHLQAYWLLREPQPLVAPADLKHFEERNRGLAQYLHADHAWDATRIFRLPGTLNHKNGQQRPVELL